jgi:hypothetical protein
LIDGYSVFSSLTLALVGLSVSFGKMLKFRPGIGLDHGNKLNNCRRE